MNYVFLRNIYFFLYFNKKLTINKLSKEKYFFDSNKKIISLILKLLFKINL